MEYKVEIYLLSPKFTKDYPHEQYSELMGKNSRPYCCLLIDNHDGYFICIPFRSNVTHKYSFRFSGTKRSKNTKSGLDYSKIVLIKNRDYFDLSAKAIVDQDEYRETIRNIEKIKKEAITFVDDYISHVNGTRPLHSREFERRYRHSTLPYFHDIIGLWN